MTTPEDPQQQPDEPFSLVPGRPVPSSLSDRLAELEADDEDDPLFDDFDDEADEEYDGEPPPAPADAGSAHEAADAAVDDGPFAVAAAEEPSALVPDDAADPTVEGAPAPVPAVTAPLAAGVVVPPTPTEVTLQPESSAGEPESSAGEPAAAPGERRRRRRMSVPVIALLLMTLLMATAAAYLWQQVREHDRAEAARKSGLETSRDAARLLFSYDYRTLDKDFATGRRLTTGEFRSQYDKTTTKVVSDVAKQYKAVVKANVVAAGVVSATPTTVVTVVYVNQVTTSTRVTGEKVDLSRVKMTLRKVDGRWLVEAVNAL